MYELNEYCSTANVLFSPGLSWSAAVLHWNLTDLRRTRRHRDTTIDPGSLGRSGQLQRLTMSCLSCLSDDPWWPLRHVFLSARNGQGFPTMQVRLLLQSGTMSFSVRQSLPMVCGSDDLSDVFSRSKPRAAMISEEARKKTAERCRDSIGFYDSPSYLEVFDGFWLVSGVLVQAFSCSGTPWTIPSFRSPRPDMWPNTLALLGTGTSVWLKWLGYDLATAQKWAGWHWLLVELLVEFFTIPSWAIPCYSHLPLSASTLSTSLLVLELWASWALNMGVWIWEAYGMVHSSIPLLLADVQTNCSTR